MSRFYEIKIDGGPTYTSHPGGRFDPNALNIELDLTVIDHATPDQNCYLKIWGVGLPVIAKANQLFNKSISIKGGMGKGLPLANPAQAGVLIDGGLITRPFGNWTMTDQALEMIIASGGKHIAQQGVNPHAPNSHIVMNWSKGQALGPALQQALSSAFPGVKIAMNIAKNIVAPQDQHSFHANLQELSYFVGRISQQIVGGNYQGVSIVPKGGQIKVGDSAKQGKGKISFTDLVGQPVWIAPKTIQFKTVMRADIDVLEQVTLPKTWINSSPQGAGTLGADQQGIQGSFQVTSVRHIGNFRQPSGDAWCSIFEATQA